MKYTHKKLKTKNIYPLKQTGTNAENKCCDEKQMRRTLNKDNEPHFQERFIQLQITVNRLTKYQSMNSYRILTRTKRRDRNRINRTALKLQKFGGCRRTDREKERNDGGRSRNDENPERNIELYKLYNL